ncbi:MAG: hypothetical protein K2K16_09585 [Ruminococcus sp.]|nr:hypothetical protein [Ruminococcus sp.]
MELLKNSVFLIIFINFVFLFIRFCVHCLTDSFSNSFDFISEKIQDIEKEEIVTSDTDNSHKINLSKDKSGG